MQVSAAVLRKISKGGAVASNVSSIVTALNDYGGQFGLDQPHRLAHFLSQLAHESGGYHWDQEIASGAAYEGRKNLGNTQRGDGKRFKGRGPIQCTGRTNYREFTKWCRKFIPDCPDFEKKPEMLNTDPYEGLSAIWYWDEGNPDPQGRSLNYYADQNNLEMVTRRINGGINGLSDRMDYYDRTALVLLGYGVKDLKAFQTDAKKRGNYKYPPDGVSGPQTRTALHMALIALTKPASLADRVAIAPVVAETEVEVEKQVPVDVPVPVTTNSLQRPFYQDPDFIERVGSGSFGTAVISAVSGADWKLVAVVAVAVFVFGGGIWYLLRVRKAAHQDAKVADIKAEAATIRAAVQ